MDNPKLFVSYSWTSPEHEKWVLHLATELRENGIDVALDKWDLREGQDADAFMEKMVTDSNVKKVIMICDRAYAEKADARKGGVGTEAQIISRKIYEATDQNKFVAIVEERDEQGNPYLPTYYRSRIYIDLSDNNLYAKNYEQLLRWVYDKPLYEKPELGKTPSFLDDKTSISLGTTTIFQRVISAVKNGEDYAQGALEDYFEIFSSNLEKFRIRREDNDKREFDDLVTDGVDQFRPYRDEAVEVFQTVAQYSQNERTYGQLHKFFERIAPYTYKPAGVTSWRTSDFDNFKFIIHELFLYCIAALIKHESFDGVAYLLNHLYYIEDDSRRESMFRFPMFCLYAESLKYRNERLQKRRLSLQADILKERSNVLGITFNQIMQADFLLFIRSSFDNLRYTNNLVDRIWWPMTMVYAEYHFNPFEVFSRAQEKQFFNRLKVVFEIEGKEQIDELVAGFRAGKLRLPSFGGWADFDPVSLMNYEKLATV